MAALPYMQLYVAEYLADTCHLNAAQHGAYLLLLINYWQRGKALPDMNDRLATVARMSNEEWIANRPIIEEFFNVENGLWTHGRVERDLLRVKSISNAGKIGGIASAKARREKTLNDRSEFVERKGNQQSINRTDTEQTNTNTLASTAIAVSADKGKLLGTLPLNDGTNWEIYSADVNELQPLYPAVDVRQELWSMKGWLIGNPTNRKTKHGIKRFITSWLDKEQDKTKPNGGNKSNGKTDRAIETATKLFNEFENNAGTHGIELLSGGGAN